MDLFFKYLLFWKTNPRETNDILVEITDFMGKKQTWAELLNWALLLLRTFPSTFSRLTKVSAESMNEGVKIQVTRPIKTSVVTKRQQPQTRITSAGS